MNQSVAHNRIKVSTFENGVGSKEIYITMKGIPDLSFSDQVKQLELTYNSVLKDLGLNQNTEVFRRFFLSDAVNQFMELFDSAIYRQPHDYAGAATSIIQQSALPDSKVALESYHVRFSSDVFRQKLPIQNRCHANGLRISHQGYDYMWLANLGWGTCEEGGDVFQQTTKSFDALIADLDQISSSLSNDVVRTWIYIRDVDKYYKSMVEARKQVFIREGLTPATRFLASTGIEGKSFCPHLDFLMDVIAIKGLSPGQMVQLDVPHMMNSPHEYGVTFERAAQVFFGDRTHIHLSGTASIDSEGRVLHPGNISKQLDRTFENIAALLERGNASLGDLALMNVYLRDVGDASSVQSYLENMAIDVPYQLLHAPVCRPEWLVEIDGVAITRHQDKKYRPY